MNTPNPFDRIAHILHIKKNTEGTSNEISFSVLDAYRKKSLRAFKRNSKSFKGGNVVPLTPLIKSDEEVYCASGKEGAKAKVWVLDTKQATLKDGRSFVRADTAPQQEGIHDEVTIGTQRSQNENTLPQYDSSNDYATVNQSGSLTQKRITGNPLVIGMICILVLSSVSFVGYWGVQEYVKAENLKENERNIIAQVFRDLEQLDARLIIPLDGIIGEKLDGSQLKTLKDLSGEIEEGISQLERIKKRVESFSSQTKDDSLKRTAEDLINAISSREIMLKQAKNIDKVSQEFFSFEQEATDIWTSFVQAEYSITESNKLIAETNIETIAQSTTLLNKAQEGLAKLQSFTSKADLKEDLVAYHEYASLELEAIDLAIQSNNAALEFDKDLADKNNALFNKKNTEAQEKFNTLTGTLPEVVYSIYEKKSKRFYVIYQEAREQAALNDSYLREYLKSQQNH